MKRKGFAWIGLALIVILAGSIIYLTLSSTSSDSNQGQRAGETEIQGAVELFLRRGVGEQGGQEKEARLT